jgi:hypothetical protein
LQLRDAAGNESIRYADAILVYPPNSLGSVQGTRAAPWRRRAGRSRRPPGLPGDGPIVTGPDGSFELVDLAPGSYDLAFFDGEHTTTLPDVDVVAGSATQLGTLLIPERTRSRSRGGAACAARIARDAALLDPQQYGASRFASRRRDGARVQQDLVLVDPLRSFEFAIGLEIHHRPLTVLAEGEIDDAFREAAVFEPQPHRRLTAQLAARASGRGAAQQRVRERRHHRARRRRHLVVARADDASLLLRERAQSRVAAPIEVGEREHRVDERAEAPPARPRAARGSRLRRIATPRAARVG